MIASKAETTSSISSVETGNGLPVSMVSAKASSSTASELTCGKGLNDVNLARVLAGFHFFNSDLEGSHLVGRRVGRYVAKHYFQPVHRHR